MDNEKIIDHLTYNKQVNWNIKCFCKFIIQEHTKIYELCKCYK